MLTKEEIDEIIQLKEEGFTEAHLSKKFNVSRRQIEKVSRDIRINSDTYNGDHIQDKYEINREVFNIVRPKTILDPFCGVKQFWRNEYGKYSTIVDNDVNSRIKCDMHKDAKTLLNTLISINSSFDLVDIDPFKHTWKYIIPGIQLAQKALIITDCSIKSSIRFPDRVDLLRKRYGIDKDLVYDGFKYYVIPRIIEIAKKEYNKDLSLYYHLPWRTGDRAWFIVKE